MENLRESPSAPELKEKLANTTALLIDIDGTIQPGPISLRNKLQLLKNRLRVIPCTARTIGEGVGYLQKDPQERVDGIYESGLVAIVGGREYVLGDYRRMEQVGKVTSLLKQLISTTGQRDEVDKYSLVENRNQQGLWGYPNSVLGKEYVSKRGVPIAIPQYPNQYSLVIWPSGNALDCPPTRDFYQIGYVIDGMILANPKLFEGLSILLGDESIMIRPTSVTGDTISKKFTVEWLANLGEIEPETTLFIGNDDYMDLEVARYIKSNNGLVVCPDNAGTELKGQADVILPNTAGFAVDSFVDLIISSLSQEKRSVSGQRQFLPKGKAASTLIELQDLVPNKVALKTRKVEEARQNLRNITANNFLEGIALAIPEKLMYRDKIINPMIYVNENSYGFPDEYFTEIDDLIVFDDNTLLSWLVKQGKIADLAQDPQTLFVFPGNGGRYLLNEMRKRSISPINYLNVSARRSFRNNRWVCDVNLPSETTEALLRSCQKMVFIDDTISTGSTYSSIVNAFEYAGWKPDEVSIFVELLGASRSDDLFTNALRNQFGKVKIFTSIFYGGYTQRPRLLTTGSIIDGLNDPQRLTEKGYPPELVNKIKLKIMQV